jgi:hypothetical protein
MDKTGSMTNIHQRGIAIGPILYIVAILAVLVSAIAAGSGSFNSDISAISAKAQATAILGYANEVKLGVDRVLGKGCTDTEISFENPIVSGYANPNAPADKSCHVFDVNGGGVIPKRLYFFGYNGARFVTCSSANNGLEGTGSYSCDLYLRFEGVEKSVCEEVNKLLGIIGNPYADCTSATAAFAGTYHDPSTSDGWIPPNSIKGKNAFCAGHNVSAYSIYFVLITR